MISSFFSGNFSIAGYGQAKQNGSSESSDSSFADANQSKARFEMDLFHCDLIKGSLLLTDYRILFSIRSKVYSIPIFAIEDCYTGYSWTLVYVYTRIFRTFKIEFKDNCDVVKFTDLLKTFKSATINTKSYYCYKFFNMVSLLDLEVPSLKNSDDIIESVQNLQCSNLSSTSTAGGATSSKLFEGQENNDNGDDELQQQRQQQQNQQQSDDDDEVFISKSENITGEQSDDPVSSMSIGQDNINSDEQESITSDGQESLSSDNQDDQQQHDKFSNNNSSNRNVDDININDDDDLNLNEEKIRDEIVTAQDARFKGINSVMVNEFERLGFEENRIWHISKLNEKFEFCRSYPQYLILPVITSDKTLEDVASLRVNRRLPTIVYRWKNGAIIARGSQPVGGFFQYYRSNADILYVETLRDVSMNDKSKKMLVVDARSYKAAFCNRVKGGGHESDTDFSEVQFKSLANIHYVRTSIRDSRYFIDSIDKPDIKTILLQRGWLTYIQDLLKVSSFIVSVIVDGRSTLVHCSDGWDRTPQLTCLTQIMLDPYYRTIKGFNVLIQKEWLGLGHKFGDRNGLSDCDTSENSPVFFQFLDCIHQLYQQFPNEFEFNLNYLETMLLHSVSCFFGTFLYNNDRERFIEGVSLKSFSFFDYVEKYSDEFKNPSYNPSNVDNNDGDEKNYESKIIDENEKKNETDSLENEDNNKDETENDKEEDCKVEEARKKSDKSILWPSTSDEDMRVWENVFLTVNDRSPGIFGDTNIFMKSVHLRKK